MARKGNNKKSGPVARKNTRGKSKSDDASVDNMTIRALKDEVMRKAAGSKPKLEKSVAKQDRKSNDVTVDDDLIMGALENEVRGKVAGDKSKGEKSVAKQSSNLKDCDVDDFLKIGAGKNEVIGQVSGGELKGEKSAARESEAGGVKLTAEKIDTHTIMKGESKQDMATPVKRKRGADGEIAQAFWSSPVISLSRLRPRKEVPAFRMVDLVDDDNERIVGKRVKVYWSGSRKWFIGCIKAFDKKNKLHKIRYEDNEDEIVDLKKELFELEIKPADGFKLKTKPSSGKKVNGLDGNKGSTETWCENIEIVDAQKVEKQSEPKDRMAPIGVKKKRSKSQSRRKGKEEDLDANKEIVSQHGETKNNIMHGDIDFDKSVEINNQEEDEEIDSHAREACVEECGMLAEAQCKKPEFNVKKKEDDPVEKQTEIEDIMASKDAITSLSLSSNPQGVKNDMDELAANADVPGLPNKVEEKVTGKQIDVEGPRDADTVKSCDGTEILLKAASEGACESSDGALHMFPKNLGEEDPETLKVKLEVGNIEKGICEEGNLTGQKTKDNKEA